MLRSRDLLSVRIDRFERKKNTTRIFKRGKLVFLEIFSLNLILVGVADSKIMAFFFETQVQFFFCQIKFYYGTDELGDCHLLLLLAVS